MIHLVLGIIELKESSEQNADVNASGYLDWTSFRRFVKMLKSRPDVARLYKRLCLDTNNEFTYSVWEKFMKTCQKVWFYFRFCFHLPLLIIYVERQLSRRAPTYLG